MNRLTCAVLAVALVGHTCAACVAKPTRAPGRYVETLVCGGLRRSFILRVPPRYDGKPIPVVVVLHGWTATARQAEVYTRMGEESDKDGFVAVFPDGLGRAPGWNADFINLSGQPNVDDVAFVSAVLDRVEQELSVDKNREYVAGHSNGAMMANLLGSKLSKRLAAIGSVAGTVGIPGVKPVSHIPTPASPISVILIHGKKDPMVAYSRSDSAVLHGVGAIESASWWASQDRCTQIVNAQGPNTSTVTYRNGRNGTEVTLVSILNGTHDWPGGYTVGPNGRPRLETRTGVSAAALLWNFFKSHPKKR